MKTYFCVYTQHSHRTGEAIGRTCCVITAENEDIARDKAYEFCGSDSSAFYSIEEIDPIKGYSYTVYKSAM